MDEDKIFENNEHVEVLSWIKIGGWLFFEDTVVVLKRSNVTTNLLPKFGKICKLIVGKKNEPYAVIKTLKTIIHEKHFHWYEVEEKSPPKIKFINLKTISKEPLWFCNIFEDDSIQYINPRHLI